MERLLLLEHNPLFREALALLLEWQTGLSSVLAGSLAEAMGLSWRKRTRRSPLAS